MDCFRIKKSTSAFSLPKMESLKHLQITWPGPGQSQCGGCGQLRCGHGLGVHPAIFFFGTGAHLYRLGMGILWKTWNITLFRQYTKHGKLLKSTSSFQKEKTSANSATNGSGFPCLIHIMQSMFFFYFLNHHFL